MAVKFSAFTTRTGTLDASTKIVRYDDPAGTKTNVEFSLATLAANSGIYSGDGTIGTTRIAKVTDTLTFQNVGGTSSLFSLNDNGTFTLGKGAAAGGGYTAVSIGNLASCGNNYSVAIGSTANTNSYTYSVALGGGAVGVTAQAGVAIGGNGTAVSGDYGIAMGYRASTSGDYSINLGSDSRGTGATSITLNSSGGIAAPAVASGFGVYMASHTYADFEVAGGVSKFSFDADSFATLTIADASDTTLASGETGDITIDAGGGVKIDADSGAITFADGGVTLATIASLRQESFIIACSDETTALTVGTNKAVFRIPYAFTLTAVAASLTTAGTTSGLTTIDINEDTTAGGVTPVSILSTKITIDLTEKTSVTAATQPVISDASLAADSQITVDIDAISGGASETGLKVTLIGYQTV